MKRADYIEAELSDLGAKILPKISSKLPYSVPGGYFMHLPDEINDIIHISEYTAELQPEWGKSLPFEAPGENYFAGLETQILAKVTAEPEWNKANPYTIPQGYFDHLPDSIITKVKKEKVVERPKRIPLFRTVQLAASMALIFFAGLGVMRMGSMKSMKNDLSGLSQTEISEYVNANLDDFDTDLILNGLAQNETKANEKPVISDAEIKAYLSETGWN